MTDESTNLGGQAAGATNTPGLPPLVDRTTFQVELDELRVREKAHTHEGDAIAAQRRRLPMVEVDPNITHPSRSFRGSPTAGGLLLHVERPPSRC
jgi:hypothetical protein